MGVSIRQSAYFAGDQSGPSVTLPQAPVQGNLLLCLSEHWTNNPTPGSGYTQDLNSNGSNSDITSVYKYAGSGESATQNVFSVNFNQGVAILFELQGVAGSYAADVQSARGAKDVALSSNAYSTSSFNTGANGVGIVAFLGMVASTSITETDAPTVTGGSSFVTEQAITQNTGVLRHSAVRGIHDYFATSGTAVQYNVSGPVASQQVGAYLIYEIKNWASPSFSSSISESASAADTISATLTKTASISETASAADTVSSTGSFHMSIAESMNAVDTVNTGGIFLSSISESASATDSISSVGNFHRAIVETAHAADTVSSVGAFAEALTDSISITDKYIGPKGYLASFSDRLTISDVFGKPIPGPEAEQLTEGWWRYFYTGLIVWVAYDPSNLLLEVNFTDGTERTFSGVPFGIAQAFVTAADPDNYYNNTIKNNYPRVFAS